MDNSLNLPEADLLERTEVKVDEAAEVVEVVGDVVKVEVVPVVEDEVLPEVDSPTDQTTMPEPTLMLPTKRLSPP